MVPKNNNTYLILVLHEFYVFEITKISIYEQMPDWDPMTDITSHFN